MCILAFSSHISNSFWCLEHFARARELLVKKSRLIQNHFLLFQFKNSSFKNGFLWKPKSNERTSLKMLQDWCLHSSEKSSLANWHPLVSSYYGQNALLLRPKANLIKIYSLPPTSFRSLPDNKILSIVICLLLWKKWTLIGQN